MELITQLHDLQKNNLFNSEEISKVITKEELFNIINEAMKNTPQMNNLYSLFDQVREIMFDQGDMNIFEEFLTIKYFYLNSAYGVDTIVLDSIMQLVGPVALDYELESRFLDNDLYNFYVKRYLQFKQNNELTVLKMLNRIDFNQLKLEGEELQKVFAELQKTAGLQ